MLMSRHCFGKSSKGHNSKNDGRTILVIKLVQVFMVINILIKFQINQLKNTQVIEWTLSANFQRAITKNNGRKILVIEPVRAFMAIIFPKSFK